MLNHVSLECPDRSTSVRWLKDVIVGIIQLTGRGVAEPTLRMCKPHAETFCMDDWSLWDTLKALLKEDSREEFIYFSRLSSKIPHIADTHPDVLERLARCEEKTLGTPDGEPLLLCAFINGIAIGFPSDLVWDRDRLAVWFDELQPDARLEPLSETIDNLSRSSHANEIVRRYQMGVGHDFGSWDALWDGKHRAFPCLAFGRDVEAHMKQLNLGLLRRTVRVLERLNDAAAEWKTSGGPIPPWRLEVRDESSSVKDNPKLRVARVFKSYDGSSRLFFLHTDISKGTRLHLRVDAVSRQVEIGYLGQHLATKRY